VGREGKLRVQWLLGKSFLSVNRGLLRRRCGLRFDKQIYLGGVAIFLNEMLLPLSQGFFFQQLI